MIRENDNFTYRIYEDDWSGEKCMVVEIYDKKIEKGTAIKMTLDELKRYDMTKESFERITIEFMYLFNRMLNARWD